MATDQNLEIFIKADATALKSGMDGAKAGVQSASAAMGESMKAMADSTKASSDQIIAAQKAMAAQTKESATAMGASMKASATQMNDAFKSSVAGIGTSMGSLGTAFTFVKGHLLALTAVIAGGAAFKAAIDGANAWNGEATKLSKSLGISTEKASVLMVATRHLGLDTEMLSTASLKMSQQIMKGGAAFEKMGVAVKDANGEFRPALDIMAETNEKLKEIKNPILQNQAGLSAYGKAWGEMRGMLKLTSTEMENAKKKAMDLGLLVGPEGAAASRQYKEAMNDIKLVMTSIEVQVGNAVLPIFKDLAAMWAKELPNTMKILKPLIELLGETLMAVMEICSEMRNVFMEVFSAVGDLISEVVGGSVGEFDLWSVAMKSVASIFQTFKAVVVEVLTVVKGLVMGFVNSLRTMAAVVKAVFSGDWDGAVKAMKDGQERQVAIAKQTGDKMVDVWNGTDKRIQDIWNKPKKAQTVPEKDNSGGPQYDFTKQKDEKDPDQFMKLAQAELAELKEVEQEKSRLAGSFREFTKKEELSFWEAKQKIVESGSRGEIAIRKTIADLKLAVDKAAFETELEAEKAKYAGFQKNADKKLELEEKLAEKIKKAYGEDSTQYEAALAAKIRAAKAAKEQERAIENIAKKTALDARLAVIDEEEKDAQAKVALGLKTNAELLAEEKSFILRKDALMRASLVEQEEALKKDPMHNPEELAKIHAQIEELDLAHRKRMSENSRKTTAEDQKYWTGMFSTIKSGWEQTFAQVMKGQMTIAQGIKNMFKSVLEAVVSTLAKIAAEWATEQLMIIMGKKAEAASVVSANAAEAGSAGVASFAAAPWPINMGAPAFGAAMSASAMSFGMMSAAGGYDIPAGTNPLTQLHAEEMVLPAHIANPLRKNLAEGDGGAGQSGGGDNHFHIHAVDAEGVRRLFMDNGGSLVRSIKAQARNFRGVTAR